jgi:PBSX family phage terminase large subunit
MWTSIYRTRNINIWEGSVRSGKTLASIIAWLLFIEQSPDFYFFMSGNTVKSLFQNVIDGEYGILSIHPGSRWQKDQTTLYIPTSQGIKVVRCFGSADENSKDSLVGLTAGGWYADELNKHHITFIYEATKRTFASQDRRHFATMNPDNPNKEVYKEFVDYYRLMSKEDKKKIGGVNYYHCTLDDNPALTPEMKTRIHDEFKHKGFEYDRFVLGKRVVAQGLVFPGVANRQVFLDFDIKRVKVRWCAIDWGVDNPSVLYFGGHMMYDNGHQIKNDYRIVREAYMDDKGKVENDVVDRYEYECKSLGIDPYSLEIGIDPSALALKNAFIRRGYFGRRGSAGAPQLNADNQVRDGISYMRSYLYAGVLRYHISCINAQREFGSYSYDPRAALRGEEVPVKVNDHCMDATRYMVNTFIKPFIGSVYKVGAVV